MKPTLEGRKIGLLYTDGSDAAQIASVRKAVEKAGGTVFLVAPKVGGAKLKNGDMLKADGQLAGSPSQLFDAVAVVLSDNGCATLLNEAAAVQFVMDAFGHLKAIGCDNAAKPLLDKAGVVADAGVTGLSKDFLKAAKLRFWQREPSVRNLA